MLYIVDDAFQRTCILFERVTAHHLDGAVLQVACAEHQTNGNTLQLVVGKLESGTLVVRVVELDTDALLSQLLHDGFHLLVHQFHLFGLGGNGDDDHLDGSQTRRQHQSVVVAVGHDERTDESGRDTP